jgi:hypothetical protein
MKLRVNWAVGIVASYVVFAGGTTAFVVYAISRPVDLVSPDYYAKSLLQNGQMDAERNAAALEGTASVAQDGDRAIVISLPAAQAADARGWVTLYRPSDASADRVFRLKADAGGRQRVALGGLRPGLWSVRLRWSAQGREFYVEQRIFVR